ncbi:MAG: hypothetical protein ACYCZB_14170 [Acidiphilium sp.]
MVTKSAGRAKVKNHKFRVAAGEVSGVRPLVTSLLVPWRSLSILLRQGWRNRPHVDQPVPGGGCSALSPEARFESEIARERLTDRQILALAIRTTRSAFLASIFFLMMLAYSVIHSIRVFEAPHAFLKSPGRQRHRAARSFSGMNPASGRTPCMARPGV